MPQFRCVYVLPFIVACESSSTAGGPAADAGTDVGPRAFGTGGSTGAGGNSSSSGGTAPGTGGAPPSTGGRGSGGRDASTTEPDGSSAGAGGSTTTPDAGDSGPSSSVVVRLIDVNPAADSIDLCVGTPGGSFSVSAATGIAFAHASRRVIVPRGTARIAKTGSGCAAGVAGGAPLDFTINPFGAATYTILFPNTAPAASLFPDGTATPGKFKLRTANLVAPGAALPELGIGGGAFYAPLFQNVPLGGIPIDSQARPAGSTDVIDSAGYVAIDGSRFEITAREGNATKTELASAIVEGTGVAASAYIVPDGTGAALLVCHDAGTLLTTPAGLGDGACTLEKGILGRSSVRLVNLIAESASGPLADVCVRPTYGLNRDFPFYETLLDGATRGVGIEQISAALPISTSEGTYALSLVPSGTAGHCAKTPFATVPSFDPTTGPKTIALVSHPSTPTTYRAVVFPTVDDQSNDAGIYTFFREYNVTGTVANLWGATGNQPILAVATDSVGPTLGGYTVIQPEVLTLKTQSGGATITTLSSASSWGIGQKHSVFQIDRTATTIGLLSCADTGSGAPASTTGFVANCGF